MSGTLNQNELNLSNQLILEAPNNNILDLEGNGGADVDVTGINDLEFSGEIRADNGALAISGHGMMLVAERRGSTSSPNIYAMGNGLDAPGPPMPTSGTIVGISLSTDTNETATATAMVNGSSSGVFAVLFSSDSGFSTGSASFSAGDLVYPELTFGSTSGVAKVAIFIRFD